MNAVNASLFSTLTGGTALTSLLAGTTSVYHLQAPDKAEKPYVVYSLQAGGPLNIAPSNLVDQVVFVRAYAAKAKAAGDIDDQIKALLHRQTLPVTGWATYGLQRETDLETVETQANGEKVYMAGGLYRIQLTD